MTNLFLPIFQEENQATFCKMLDKSDSSVSLEMGALQIWSHWRAFITFPFTIFLDSHFGQIKILDCQIHSKFKTLDHLNQANNLENNLNNDCKITKLIQKNNWIQIKINRQSLTFLICNDQTLLQIGKIGLENGKRIDFSGFSFD